MSGAEGGTIATGPGGVAGALATGGVGGSDGGRSGAGCAVSPVAFAASGAGCGTDFAVGASPRSTEGAGCAARATARGASRLSAFGVERGGAVTRGAAAVLGAGGVGRAAGLGAGAAGAGGSLIADPGVPRFAGSSRLGRSTMSASPRFCVGLCPGGTQKSASSSTAWSASEIATPRGGRRLSTALSRSIIRVDYRKAGTAKISMLLRGPPTLPGPQPPRRGESAPSARRSARA